MDCVKFSLQREMFASAERPLCTHGKLRVSTFLYESGVQALRVQNDRLALIVLPFQGQQIWRMYCDGRDLTMSGMFDTPVPTRALLMNYGAFLLHCGMTGMGVPAGSDTHAHHGELPNMPYPRALIAAGEDENGRYLSIEGETEYRVGFTSGYRAEPQIKLYEKATVADVYMRLTNLRSAPMEYMYLCHINFRPFEAAKLIYSAPCDSAHIHVHQVIPDTHPEEKRSALAAYMQKLKADPQCHNIVGSETQIYDPEIVMTIRYLPDREGMAHCMQRLPDGSASYAAFAMDTLPYGLRWISRGADEQAMGMVLPATAEHLGYTYAKAHGQIPQLAGKASATFHVRAGYLDQPDAERMVERITKVLAE